MKFKGYLVGPRSLFYHFASLGI